jgi:hypothetical protein
VSLALSDVDDDGDRDIVLVSVNDSDDQRVRVIRNTTILGNGLSFASAIDAPSQPTGLPLIVRAADLDGNSPAIADDLVVLVDPLANPITNGSSLNSIDLSGTICPADLNRDGQLDFFDVSAFLIRFGEQNPGADMNQDGMFDFFDVSQFIVLYMNGCDDAGGK